MQKIYRVSSRDLEETLEIIRLATNEIEKEILPDGRWLITATFPDGETPASETAPEDPTPVAAPASAPASSTPDNSELGVLSARFESGSRSSAAIGDDSTGGFSYGKYQIATKTGTMKEFLDFCASNAPAVAAALNGAGGVSAATAGSNTFKTKWRELAGGAALPKAEHGFIEETHYTPFVNRLDSIGLHVARRSWALKNVCWSVAVQHGSANNVVKNALDPLSDPASLTDKAIIQAIYKERSNVNKYFSRSTKAEKDSVKERFKQELKDALEILANES